MPVFGLQPGDRQIGFEGHAVQSGIEPPGGIIGPYQGVNIPEGHNMKLSQVPAETDGGDHQVRHPRIVPFLAPPKRRLRNRLSSGNLVSNYRSPFKKELVTDDQMSPTA